MVVVVVVVVSANGLACTPRSRRVAGAGWIGRATCHGKATNEHAHHTQLTQACPPTTNSAKPWVRTDKGCLRCSATLPRRVPQARRSSHPWNKHRRDWFNENSREKEVEAVEEATHLEGGWRGKVVAIDGAESNLSQREPASLGRGFVLLQHSQLSRVWDGCKRNKGGRPSKLSETHSNRSSIHGIPLDDSNGSHAPQFDFTERLWASKGLHSTDTIKSRQRRCVAALSHLIHSWQHQISTALEFTHHKVI
jgi:hypothetical protein